MYGQNNPYSQYPYTGYAYPNYGQRNFMQPQQQMQQTQPQQPVMPTLCYAKMEEAKPYIITAPNSSMLFIDREKGKALLKTTDNVCNSHSKYFNLIETDENGNPLQAKKEEVAPQIDPSIFATKKEVEELIREYNYLVEQVKNLQKPTTSVGVPKSNEKVLVKGNTQANP